MWSRLGCLGVLVVFVSVVSDGAECRTWSDRTGNHQTEAELVSAEDGIATLRKKDGKTVRVPVEKLSEADQKFLAQLQESSVPNAGEDSEESGIPSGEAAVEMTTYRNLQRFVRGQRDARFVVDLYERFLASTEANEKEKEQARKDLPEWKTLSEKQSVRAGNKWMAPDEFKQAKQDEIRLIKEAHRLIDIKNDDLAKEKFLEASDVNPEAVRAEFYLGLLNALIAHYPPEADDHFKECISRLARDEDLLTGVRRANYVAALNNLAIIQVRLGRYREGIGYWRRAIQIAPFTPELVQNLGLMSNLSQTTGFVRLPKELRRTAGDLYAKATVENSLARFDENVGWLFMPYIDTFDGSMDSSGDEELVTVGWCTGFSIGGEYVLTSRYPLVEADRIVVREGGNTFEAPAGKVVSIADDSHPAIRRDSHLAVIRIDGLDGKPLPFNLATPNPAQDVTIVGYGNPGLVNNTLQQRVATILAPPSFYEDVHAFTVATEEPNTVLVAHDKGFRRLMMHDAITDPGLEGAPLIDSKGRVVGIHLGNRPEFGEFGSKHSWAESGANAVERISSVISDVNPDTSSSEDALPLGDKALQEFVTGSIYQLAIQRRAPRLAWSHRIEELHRLQKQGSWTSYEDRTCMVCNGKKSLKCPNRCARGTLRKKESVLIHRNERGQEMWGTKDTLVQCPKCEGTGFVDCPNCN